MFVPVLFGTFLKNVPARVPLAAALTALLVHFGVYYGRLTPYMAEGTRNPGISAALAILAAVAVGGTLQLIGNYAKESSANPQKADSLAS